MQVIIKSAIIGQLAYVDWDTEEDEVVKQFGEQSNSFVFSYIVSVIGAGGGMAMFLKVGPSRIVGEGWNMSTISPLVLCFLAVFLTLFGKMFLLQDMMPDSSGWFTAELAGVWASFLLFPQFLISLYALSGAVGSRRLFPIIAQYPAFLATPMLTSLTFGPHTEYGYVSFSPKYTLVNFVVTTVMTAALVFVSIFFYAVSYGELVGPLGFLVICQFFTLVPALVVQFPNSKIAKHLQFDVAVLNVISGESEDVVTT